MKYTSVDLVIYVHFVKYNPNRMLCKPLALYHNRYVTHSILHRWGNDLSADLAFAYRIALTQLLRGMYTY